MPVPDMSLLEQWLAMAPQVDYAKKVIEHEQSLRKLVIASFFPTPVEGTNTIEFSDSSKLKLGFKIDRKIDEPSLQTLRSVLEESQIRVDTLVGYEPKLTLKAYRALSEENRTMFDQILIIKTGSHTLDYVKAK